MTRVPEIEKKILKHVSEILSELLPDDNNPLLIALSGGGDSIALACLVQELYRGKNREIYAYHLNHGLRGERSDSDEAFVKTWCMQKAIILRTEKANNLEDFRQTRDFSIEEAAREYRYERLVNFAREIGVSAVLTGHTLDDDIETFLLRTFTGSSLKALSGIREKTYFTGIPVIRPLLSISRDGLREYLRSINESWCEDETNEIPDTFRNRIRLEILPFMEKIFERDIKSGIARTISNLKLESELLEAIFDESALSQEYWDKLDTQWKDGFITSAHNLKSVNESLRNRILLWAFNELKMPLKRRKADIFRLSGEFINLKGGKKHHHIGDGLYIARSGKAFIVARTKNVPGNLEFDPLPRDSRSYILEMINMSDSEKSKKIIKPGKYQIGDIEITVESVDSGDIRKTKSSGDKTIEYFDPSILDGGFELVFGGTITGTEEKEKKPQVHAEYEKLGNRTLVDHWVKWPVIKKEDKVIWIVGVCKGDSYSKVKGEKAIKISARLPKGSKLSI